MIYTVLGALIYTERGNLEKYYFNKISFWIFILFGGVFRALLDYSSFGSGITLWSVWLMLIMSIGLIYLTQKAIIQLPPTNKNEILWILFGAFVGVTLNVILSSHSLLTATNYLTTPKPDLQFLLKQTRAIFIYELSVFAIPEEFIFRGFFLGGLAFLGWSNRKILLIQCLVFVVIHVGTANAYSLFIAIPIGTLVFCTLVWKSGSINTSIAAHASYNAIDYVIYEFAKLLF
jgi:membrane protease YdiL (CAAX protease family)